MNPAFTPPVASIANDLESAIASPYPLNDRPSPDPNSAQQLIIIDGGLTHISTLVDGISAKQVVVLDPGQDGVEQISTLLGQYAERSLVFQSLQIFSHGSTAALQLGNARLDATTLDTYGDALTEWGDVLVPGGDVLLYSCNVGADSTGLAFAQVLSDRIGADVAVSTDLTGSAAQGGNWVLEYATGDIESESLVIQEEAIASYNHVLNTPLQLGNDTTTGGTLDPWRSNLIINKSDLYTNTSGSPQQVQIDTFNFYAQKRSAPITPFVVRVNGENDFTVVAVGAGRTPADYQLGTNAIAFDNGEARVITLQPGESIAPGFLDAQADGDDSKKGAVVPYDTNGLVDAVWITGGKGGGSHSGRVAEGTTPRLGDKVLPNETRNYHFNIGITVLGDDLPVNQAPELTALSSPLSVQENVSSVINLSAIDDTDSEGSGLTYAISGADKDRFTLNPSNGKLTFTAAPDYETPQDENSDNRYELTVTVTDSEGAADTQVLLVDVTDVDETPSANTPPTITSNDGQAVATLSVDENTTTVIDIEASDADGDTEGNGLAYSLDGLDVDRFIVNEDTGAIAFADAPDFEAPQDAGTDNVYNVTVTVTDSDGSTARQALNIQVQDVDDTLPEPGVTINLGNLSTTGGTLDRWRSNLVINETDTYTNTSGGTQEIRIDQFKFYAQKRTAPITPFLVQVNGDNDFTVIAVGTSFTPNDYQIGANALAFTLGDAPTIAIAPGATIAPGFLDATANGANSKRGAVIPYDNSSPDEIWLTGGPGGGSHTGTVTAGQSPGLGYRVLTTLRRRYHYSIDITSIDDMPPSNQAPTITSNNGAESVTISVNEGTLSVMDIDATDPDGETDGNGLSYTLSGEDANQFTVSDTGDISFVAAPDYEAPTDTNGDNAYNVTVTVTDSQDATDSQELIVEVENISDSPDILQFSSSGFGVDEADGTIEITVSRTGDSTDPVSVDYETLGGFAIGGEDYLETSGTLTFADGETSQSFQIQILDDSDVEGDETFSVGLSNPIGADLGNQDTAIVTINNDDGPTEFPDLTPVLPTGFIAEEVDPGAEFRGPTGLKIAPDGRIFVTEKDGKVFIVENGQKLATPFLDLSDEVQSRGFSQGLAGFAFDPNFEQNGYVYLFYTITENGESFGRLSRFTVSATNPNQADPNSRLVLLGQTSGEFPFGDDIHLVGDLKFGSDGTLLISHGDGAGNKFNDPDVFNAQDLTNLAGAISRVDPATGLGLPSNPFFTGNPADPQSKIWAFGLRNPYRFEVKNDGSTDPAVGNPGSLYIGDVGRGRFEELNIATGGENFGWPYFQGNVVYQSGGEAITQTDPAIAWAHDFGQTSIGGAFYSGDQFPPDYQGRYFHADYTSGWIRMIEVDANNTVVSGEAFATGVNGITDLEYDPLTQQFYFVALNQAAGFRGELYTIRYDG